MRDIAEAVVNEFVGRIKSRELGDGALVTLPFAMSTGNLVRVYVEQMGDDSWFVTDRGSAAAELALAGVNLDTQKAAGASWAHLRRTITVEPPLFRNDVRDYDLAGLTDTEGLGRSVLAIGEGVVRGEALRALAPGFRRRRFRDVIIQAAGKKNLPVVPDAPMPTKHNGQRRVSLMVPGAGERGETYIQGISASRSSQETFDMAQSLLTSAALGEDRLAIVLQHGVRLEKWQRQTLEDHGAPVEEDRLDEFMAKLAS